MSFIDKLPAAYQSIKVQQKNAENQSMDLWNQIGEGDYGYHECDCEYCPVPELPDLSPAERVAIEEEAEKVDELIVEYKSTLKSIEGYAKLMQVNLEPAPKESE